MRDEIAARFLALPSHHSSMAEVTAMCFVEVAALCEWSIGLEGLPLGDGLIIRDFLDVWFHKKYQPLRQEWVVALTSVPARTEVLPMLDLTLREVSIPISPNVPGYQWGCLGPQTGTVKFYKVEKGYGFIYVGGGRHEIYFQGTAGVLVQSGDAVTFLCGWHGMKRSFAFAVTRCAVK